MVYSRSTYATNPMAVLFPVLDDSQDLFQATSPDGTLLYVNTSWRRMLGYNPDDRLPARFEAVVHPDDRDAVNGLFAYLRVTDSPQALTLRLIGRDRRTVWIQGYFRWSQSSGVGAVGFDESGLIWGCFQSVGYPGYERRRMEQEILKALEKEKELNELRSRFITTISHEFRTPLTAIQSAAELLEYYEWSEEERQERFRQIHDAVQQMTQLLEDVLIMGRVEAGKLEQRPRCLDLVKFCHTLIADITLTAPAPVDIRLHVPEHWRDVCLDATLLRQILGNLLSNAVKYSPIAAPIHFTIQDRGNHWITFQVADQGIGIPASDRDRLFEPFYRASNVETIQGTGLGLSIVKRCVELQGGELQVESEIGKGTTFTVSLPLPN